MFGLYIHIPYCRSKCRYCDFYSTPCPDGVPEAYIDALCREMDRFSPCGSTPLRPDTLYFGGGTPSLLTPAQAARLIRAAGPAPGAEITLEANPETVTPERLAAFRRAGVNRLSLGIQTARDDSLARLGRRHTAAQSRRALGMAVQAGFTDISGDLMLALPAYTMAELDETIALLAESGCTHISGYLLKIEPNTVFGKRPPEALPDDDAAADFYLAAVEKLAALAVAYDAGDARRVQHFMKVYAFCRLLGRSEGLGEEEQNILEAAALLHDIGIHEAERKHGSSGGKWQELEGPAVAAPLLAQAGALLRSASSVSRCSSG